jgi:hypothetical protein
MELSLATWGLVWDMFGTTQILGLFLGTLGTILGPLWDKILSTSGRS